MPPTAAHSVRTGLALLLWGSAALAGTTRITFDQLELYADSGTARGAVIDLEYQHTEAERDLALQWSNPALTYGREEVASIAEDQLRLSKNLTSPWVLRWDRAGWRERIRSAAHRREHQRRIHLADLKGEYVSIALTGRYLEHLEQLSGMLDEASAVAQTRFDEGRDSGLEHHLVKRFVFKLDDAIGEVRRMDRERRARWKVALGLVMQNELELVTEVGYQAASLSRAERLRETLTTHPGVRELQAASEAQHLSARADRARSWPTISLEGGYKRVADGGSGYVAGVSLGLPLFHQNRAAARRSELSGRILEHQAKLAWDSLDARLETVIESITEYKRLIESARDPFGESTEVCSGVLYAYRQGQLSLSEFLSAVQLEFEGLDAYHGLLTRYYLALFELEILTGDTLVRFEEEPTSE